MTPFQPSEAVHIGLPFLKIKKEGIALAIKGFHNKPPQSSLFKPQYLFFKPQYPLFKR
jgi:hypothetical protein